MTEPTPWGAWLALAARTFALTPRAFWRLSVREWRALVTPPPTGLTRAAFADLTARFPDDRGNHG